MRRVSGLFSASCVGMYLTRGKWPSKNGKVYKTVYLRESYRLSRQVKTRMVAKLTHCSEAELDAIKLALKHKGNLAALRSVESVELVEGSSVGAVWTVYEVARRRGMEKALGKSFQGQLGLWQVMARVIHQGKDQKGAAPAFASPHPARSRADCSEPSGSPSPELSPTETSL
jgi:hypothetical protein